jgi:hypothetical protein
MSADRLIGPATTGMLLGIRRGVLEKTRAATIGEYILVDMALFAVANAMRLQSIGGNTALIIENELFDQPSLRAKWRKENRGRSDGLAVDEYDGGKALGPEPLRLLGVMIVDKDKPLTEMVPSKEPHASKGNQRAFASRSRAMASNPSRRSGLWIIIGPIGRKQTESALARRDS